MSLIDTIEPVKYFWTVLPITIFENISIELQDTNIIITQSESSVFDFKKWFEDKMQNMGDWLKDTKAEYVDGNTIEELVQNCLRSIG